MSSFIHTTAVIDKSAEIDDDVWIGPYTIIGKDVKIGRETRVEGHSIIEGNTIIGKKNHIFPYASIGREPQDIKYRGEETFLNIGDENIIREFVTINRGTPHGGGVTRIGNKNFIMAYSHVAHDCRIHNETILINGATLAGHVEVQDFAVVGAFTGVHQFTRIGKYSFIGGYSVITQDVPPFSKVVGARPAQLIGINGIGLRRRGMSREEIESLQVAFKIIFFSEMNTSQALEKIEKEGPDTETVRELINFIKESKRGVIKKVSLEIEED
ncbi:MAG: acyl-ACP--UDP-N-acetylglucosamine O-acyltransferase [Candidatus Aminicenantia bacterium]